MARIPYLLSGSSQKTCRGWPKADAPQSETDGPERYIRVEMDIGVVLGRYGSTTEDDLWESHRSYDFLGIGCQWFKGWQSSATNHRFSRDWLVLWTIWYSRKGWDIVHWLRTVEHDGVGIENGGHGSRKSLGSEAGARRGQSE